MVTTGARFGTVVLPAVMSAPLNQDSIFVPKATPTGRHHGKIGSQLLEHIGDDSRRHALGAAPDGGRRNLVAAQNAERVDPAALVEDLPHGHAAMIGAVQAVQANAGMAALDLGDNARKALPVVDLAIEADLDLVGEPS